ncbi:hypothetical protein ACJJIW_20145 [Microbulbifer sp. JMSA004]|uniref:hypothetical protein n=1 Tax=unclassified Microbulbifer TaxID=2619833 RepID=UPI0024AD0FA5|nr:hypothetical protein [Microbulbifer sp. VAAF005]WHI46620.1 hypothetical protein P0078_23420 [Microbulbifer sp. VAAF005]
MKKIVLIFFAVIFPAISFAETATVTGEIDKVKFFNVGTEGGVFIYMDNLPNACNLSGGHQRVAITSDNPSHNAVLSAVLAAKMSMSEVSLTYTLSCDANSLSWDFSNFQIN